MAKEISMLLMLVAVLEHTLTVHADQKPKSRYTIKCWLVL